MRWRRAAFVPLAMLLMAQRPPESRQNAEALLQANNMIEAHGAYRRALAACEAGVAAEPLDDCLAERIGARFTALGPGALEADERTIRRELSTAGPAEAIPLRTALFRNLADQERYSLLLEEMEPHWRTRPAGSRGAESAWRELSMLRAEAVTRTGNPSEALRAMDRENAATATPLFRGMIAEARGDAQAALGLFPDAARSYLSALASYRPLQTAIVHVLRIQTKLLDAYSEFDTEARRHVAMDLAQYLERTNPNTATGYAMMAFFVHEFPAWIIVYDAAVEYAQDGAQLDFPLDCGSGLINNGRITFRAGAPALFARHNLVKGLSFWVRSRYDEAEFCMAWAYRLAGEEGRPAVPAIRARALLGLAAAELHRVARGSGSRARLAQLLRASRHYAEGSLSEFNQYRIVLNSLSGMVAQWSDPAEAYVFAQTALQGALRRDLLLPNLAHASWLAGDVDLANPIAALPAAWAAAHRQAPAR